MMNVEKFVAAIERADALKLAAMLRRPSAEETVILRNHLGVERFERMHRLAEASLARAEAAEPKGNVVVIPTLLGSELTAFSPGGGQEPIWFNMRRLLADGIDRLRIEEAGSPGTDGEELRPTGVLKRYYGELLLALAGRWNVQSFPYDWRRDLNESARCLAAWLEKKFPGQPVHLIGFGMGGQLARAFVARHADQWRRMWDGNPRPGPAGRAADPGRHCQPRLIRGGPDAGRGRRVREQAGPAQGLARPRRSAQGDPLVPRDLSDASRPLVVPGSRAVVSAHTYSDLESVDIDVPQRNLDSAHRFHEVLRRVVDADRMHAILGYGQATVCGIRDFAGLDRFEAYQITDRGDGMVPVDMGLLAGVRSSFVCGDHAELTTNREIVAALDELLSAGCSDRLDDDPGPGAILGSAQILAQSRDQELRRTEELARSLKQDENHSQTGVDYHLEASFMRDLLSSRKGVARRSVTPSVLMKHPRVELSLVHGKLAHLEYDRYRTRRSQLPMDAIAVGHYLGVKPAGAERELDEAISRAILDLAPEQPIKESDLVLTQYSERGILKGELGQPFFLPDPRDHTGRRVIAVAGMGVPGRFGWPELTVLARELCWSVGRLGKRHLAIEAMGTRYGNIPLADVIRAWIRGLKHAVTGTLESENRHIERLMLVLPDPRLMEAAHAAILAEINQLEDQRRLDVFFDEFTDEKLDFYAEEGFKLDELEMKEELRRRRQRRSPKPEAELMPTRVTLALEGNSYHFGALTSEASVPERAVPLDPVLVQQANARLAAEDDPDRQFAKGQFLRRLLVPEDLRRALDTPAPLVMMLDRETAKIHWEMVAAARAGRFGGHGIPAPGVGG